MDYRKLKAKLVELGYTQRTFGEAIGLSEQSINQRLSGSIEWKTTEIIKACEVLNIPLEDAWQYFFVQKV